MEILIYTKLQQNILDMNFKQTHFRLKFNATNIILSAM